MTKIRAVAAIAIITLTGAAAHADGDAAKGKARSLACQACHITADPASATPRLVGQRPAYLAGELAAFKSGDRTSELMTPIASQLSDADIADLAAYWSGLPPTADATVPAEVTAITTSPMTFPAAFPKGFTVYEAADDPAKGTITRHYVNAKGRAAAKAGKPLPDGTVIIVASYKAKPTPGADGALVVEAPTSYSGMEARAGWGAPIPALLRNGNWAYGLFDAKGASRPLNQAVCLACHQPAAATSYVFTLDAIKTAATQSTKKTK